ncbi:MAG: FAD-binding protein [Lachnospiraceae bacterium]
MTYVWSKNEELIEAGYLQKADTLEELAEKLNIPVDNFVATVNRYNELCAAGVDEDYGKEKHRLTPVDTAPFYGIRTGAWHLTTLNGCRINTDMQVLDTNGEPIRRSLCNRRLHRRHVCNYLSEPVHRTCMRTYHDLWTSCSKTCGSKIR